VSLLSEIRLQPLTMGQILDRALRLYRNNFLKFLGVAALVQIPAALLGLLPLGLGSLENSSLANDPSLFFPVMLASLGGILVVVVFSILWSQVGSAALTQLATDAYLSHPIGIGDAFRKIGRSWLTLVGAVLRVTLTSLGLFLFFVIPCVGWAAAVPGFGLFIFLATVVLPLTIPVVVLERKSAGMAPRRAWELARQRFWWVFGFFLLLGIFSLLVVQGPNYLVIWAVELLGAGVLSEPMRVALQTASNSLFGVLYFPIQIACVLLVYLDLRVRLEGLDLAFQAQNPLPVHIGLPTHVGALTQDGVTTEVDAVLRHAPNPPADSKLIVGSEWGNFVAITIGIGVILAIFFTLFSALLMPLVLQNVP
jgi:hypothetical protein